jgi:hypothetical protein
MVSNPTPQPQKPVGSPRRYTIEKITDIFEIPEDRFSDFLVDFESYYRMGRPMADLIKEVAKTGGVDAAVVSMKMVWVDDEKHDVKVHLKTPEVKS